MLFFFFLQEYENNKILNKASNGTISKPVIETLNAAITQKFPGMVTETTNVKIM